MNGDRLRAIGSRPGRIVLRASTLQVARDRTTTKRRIMPHPREYCPTPEALFTEYRLTATLEAGGYQRLAATRWGDIDRIRPHQKKKKIFRGEIQGDPPQRRLPSGCQDPQSSRSPLATQRRQCTPQKVLSPSQASRSANKSDLDGVEGAQRQFQYMTKVATLPNINLSPAIRGT
jgi:hypothetical protein